MSAAVATVAAWRAPEGRPLRVVCVPDAAGAGLDGTLAASEEVTENDGMPAASAVAAALAADPERATVLVDAGADAGLAAEVARELAGRELPEPVAVVRPADAGDLPALLDRVATLCADVEHFVVSETLADEDVDRTTPLLELGLVDSVTMMAILAYVEHELGLAVPDDDVVPANFVDVAAMQRMVVRLARAR